MNTSETPWTTDLEVLIRQMGEKASILRILHRMEASRLSRLDAMIVIPSILVQVVSAGVQGAADSESSPPSGVLIAINLTSAALFSLSKHMRFTEHATEHQSSSLAYGKLYRRITTELATQRQYRSPAQSMLNVVRDAFDNIYDRAPVIPRRTVSAFMGAFDNNEGIALPDICNGLSSIKITGDEQNNVCLS